MYLIPSSDTFAVRYLARGSPFPDHMLERQLVSLLRQILCRQDQELWGDQPEIEADYRRRFGICSIWPTKRASGSTMLFESIRSFHRHVEPASDSRQRVARPQGIGDNSRGRRRLWRGHNDVIRLKPPKLLDGPHTRRDRHDDPNCDQYDRD